MRPTSSILKVLAASFALLAIACNNSTPPGSIAGSYTATTFVETYTGQSAVNVLGQGGSLTIVIAANNTTTGNLLLPASANGGTQVSASMAGTMVKAGSKVNFDQPAADTFVRNLNWLVVGSTLQVSDQIAGSGTFTITLTRQ